MNKANAIIGIISFAASLATLPAQGELIYEPILPQAPPAILGVWRQSDAGMYLTITQDSADFYHFTKFCCYKDRPSSGKPLANSYRRYRLDEDNSKLTLFRYDFADRFDRFFSQERFVRVDALPAGTIVEPDNEARFHDPEFVFDLVWHQFEEQFPFFKQRHFDWSALYDRFRPQVTSTTADEELYTILVSMLTGLGDSHTRIYWEEKDQPFKSGEASVIRYLDDAFAKQTEFDDAMTFRGHWSHVIKTSVNSQLAQKPFRTSGNGRIRWGVLKGNIGYIELDVLSGFAPDGSSREEEVENLEREVDRIISEFQNCKAVIIDLSMNQGGFDLAGAVIASRFADHRRHVLSTYSMGQDPTSARKLFIGPLGPRQFTGPVYVLTTNATVSAGETLTMMLKGFPHVVHVGEATRGCLSSILNKGMPNAFHVTMSNEFWVSPQGTIYEGNGVPPDIAFTVFDKDDLFGSYPSAVRKTLDLATGSEKRLGSSKLLSE